MAPDAYVEGSPAQRTEDGEVPQGGAAPPLEPRNVLRRFELLTQRAGLRGVHLHTLRHSTASFLLAAGTHTKVVQEHLGNSGHDRGTTTRPHDRRAEGAPVAQRGRLCRGFRTDPGRAIESVDGSRSAQAAPGDDRRDEMILTP
jgi:hypothetical protein